MMGSFNPISNYSYTTSLLQRNLQINQVNINRTLERLSTGLRINRAADDPLGITLAKNFQTKLISNRQAISNTQRATSLADTASSGAQSVLSNLQRIRELTLESLSDSNSDSERARIQSEVNTLVQDIDRLARGTSFNSRNLLDGSISNQRLSSSAVGDLLTNATLSNTDGSSFNFLSAEPILDPNVGVFDTVQFRLFDNGSGGFGLEVSSANSGVVVSYDDVDNAPTNISVGVGSGSGTVNVDFSRNPFSSAGSPSSGPLTGVELNTRIQDLVDSGRLDPVTYGDLDISLGGNSFSSYFTLTADSTIQDFLDATSALSGVNASYDTNSGLFAISYTGSAQATSSNSTTYDTSGTPTGVGGPFADFASLPNPSDGPAYRDPSSFLPSVNFAYNSLPAGTVFPTIANLDTGVDFTGSTANVLNFFGVGTLASDPTITSYSSEFYGDAVATGNPNEYVNRTRVVITSAAGEQNQTGNDTGLTAADLTRSFDELTRGYVVLNGGATSIPDGDFEINFGTNGTFHYDFDESVDSVQDLLDAINTYGSNLSNGGSVSASFDSNTGRVEIFNTPPGGVGTFSKLDSGTSFTNNGVIQVDVDGDGSSDFDISQPGNKTIQEFEDEFNAKYYQAFGQIYTDGVSAKAARFTVDDPLDPGYPVPGADGFEFENILNPGGGITFSGPNGAGFVNLFKLDNNGSSIVSSTSDVDNGNISPLLDINSADVQLASIGALISTPLVVLPNDQITFGADPTSSGVADLLNLTSAPDTPSSGGQSITSSGDINNGNVYTGSNILSESIQDLLTPDAPQVGVLIGEEIVIEGSSIINITGSTSMQNILDAVNAFNGSDNRIYQASFDAGRLSIRVLDNENLSAPGSSAPADPGGASPTVNGNEVTLDTAAYTVSGGGAPPVDQPTFSSNNPGAPFSFVEPTAPGDISSIVLGGASNFFSVLNLANAPSASDSGPTVTLREYRATSVQTGPTRYDLTSEQRNTFEATSSSNSASAVGNDTGGGGGGGGFDSNSIPEDGVVAEYSIFPAFNIRESGGLTFQVGGEQGNTLSFGVNEITAEALSIEGLTLFRSGDSDNLARLRGENALRIVDNAIEGTLDALNQLGIFQRVLENNESYLSSKQLNLSAALSNIQDANVEEEIANLTQAQLNVQVGSALLAQNTADVRSAYSLLFGGGFG